MKLAHSSYLLKVVFQKNLKSGPNPSGSGLPFLVIHIKYLRMHVANITNKF
jgi:hypothetical protein